MATSQTTAQAAVAGARDERVALAGRVGFWKDALRRRMLAAADFAAVLVAASACAAIDGAATGLWIAATAPLWLVLAKLRGLYDRDHARIRHLTLDEASGLFHWTVPCGAATAVLVVVLPGELLSVPGALVMGFAAFASAFALRALARGLWRRLVPSERGLIVGSGRIADAFARRLALESGHHLDVVAQVGLATEPRTKRHFDAGMTLDEWEALVTAERVERVIVALQDLDEQTLSRVVSRCRALGVKLSVAPPMRAMFGSAVELSHLAELPLIEFRTWDPSRSTMLLKRTIDVVGAGVLVTLLAPWLLLIALAIRLDSRGPAVFRQQRAGRQGVPFEMLKFRTMVQGADARVAEVVSLEELSDPVFKLRSDPRVTRVGRFLRRSSADELLQLFNVLRGDMSLVGPRPEEVWLVERYDERDRFRLEMRPGITGPMQVHGRGELTFQERMSVEREYVENYSLRKDVKILCQTIAAVISGRGAF